MSWDFTQDRGWESSWPSEQLWTRWGHSHSRVPCPSHLCTFTRKYYEAARKNEVATRVMTQEDLQDCRSGIKEGAGKKESYLCKCINIGVKDGEGPEGGGGGWCWGADTVGGQGAPPLHLLTGFLWLLKSESEVAQSCRTLCDPMDCSLPGSSVQGIFQARVPKWVAISFSRGSSWPRNQTRVSAW